MLALKSEKRLAQDEKMKIDVDVKCKNRGYNSTQSNTVFNSLITFTVQSNPTRQTTTFNTGSVV